MKKRSEIIADGAVVSSRVLRNHATDPVRAEFYFNRTLERWNDIPQERERIRTIVRRMNRRFKRMSGQGFDNA